MGIKKSDVSTFISHMISARKNEISEPARALIRETITPIVMEQYSFYAQAEREAERLLNSLDKIRAEHPQLDTWNIKNTCTDITRNVSSFRGIKVTNYSSAVFTNLFNNATNGLPKELHDAEQDLKKSLAKQITKYRKIDKLSSELQTIIESCRNGDIAYKRLVELKVNMKGFEPAENKNLPALIKLSEDVCVINGDCA